MKITTIEQGHDDDGKPIKIDHAICPDCGCQVAGPHGVELKCMSGHCLLAAEARKNKDQPAGKAAA